MVGEPAGWCAALVKDPADAPEGGIDGHVDKYANGGKMRKKTVQIPKPDDKEALNSLRLWTSVLLR